MTLKPPFSGFRPYSPNSDIWLLRRDWKHIKDEMLAQFNDGSYQFSLLDRYEFDDAIISLWCSQAMMVLKLIAQALQHQMGDQIPKSCYHTRGHGGLKKAIIHTHEVLSKHHYVMRSDIKGYYEPIRFDVLMGIVESYVQHPVLLILLRKALRRTETRDGNFYDFYDKGIPMGSPLSPLLGTIALIPLDKAMGDKAMGQVRGIFYARFMDDWVVLTRSKTALRKVVKITRGFNFLGYYMDDQKMLPSTETIRRFHERSLALYEPSQANRNVSRRYKRNPHGRDISAHQATEPAPTEAYFQNILNRLLSLAAQKPDTLATMRRYVDQWCRWLKLGLTTIKEFDTCVQTLLPSLSACWGPGAKMLTLGACL